MGDVFLFWDGHADGGLIIVVMMGREAGSFN
jgi:hypothetical protein